ncbi:MAG: hypothetical protein KC656_00100 [Myxococcales bacterium]|nr:hypothetical protein [Myxococcales bacterium]
MLVALIAAWACEGPASQDAMRERIDAGIQAFADLDLDAVSAAAVAVEADVHCLAGPIRRGLVADLHRLRALDAYTRRDLALTEASFASARWLDPGHSLPASVVAPGSPISRHVDAWTPDRSIPTVLDPPRSGQIFVDGRPDATVDRSRPVVFQWVDAGGRARTSVIVDPGAPLPEYPHRRKARRVLLPLALGTATVAAGAWGGAHLAVREYDAAVTAKDPDRMQATWGTARGLTLAAAGTGTVALGLGVASLF